MDRQIRHLALAIMALFVLLLGQVNYLQVFAADRLVNHSGNTKRLLVQEYDVARGAILAADRTTILAESVETRGELKYLRRYPDGPLFSDVTGYYSFVYGRSELEQTQNDFLAARAAELVPSTLADQIMGRDKQGATVITTIDPALQEIAARELGGRPGALAAIDPRSGDVRALVSVPPYDPNALSSHEGDAVRSAWRRLNGASPSPLVSGANDELFPPGSTFKLITASAALEAGFGPESRWPNPRALDLPQTVNTLKNFGGSHCAGGAAQITLAEAFRVSCNVTFGEIALELGADRLAEQAHAYGFSEEVPFDIPFQEGRFPDPSVFEQQIPQIAFSGIGQFDVAANPMQMALVASAIADGGVMMRPRLVAEIRDPQGRVVARPEPSEYGRPISEETAVTMTRLMESVVASGTGTAAQIPGVDVAGKTGTAQHGEGLAPHAWFVGFAPAANPEIAVAVVVFDGGSLGSEATGGRVAAPIAKAVMEAALGG